MLEESTSVYGVEYVKLSSLLLLFSVSPGLGFAGAANTFVENEELRVKRSQRLSQLFDFGSGSVNF
jgi:hypothetical protein